MESRRGCLASVENKEEVTVELQKEKKLLEKRAKLNPYINQEKKFYIQKNYLKMPNFTIQKKVILLKD